jgi:hypothetical protein
MTGPPRSIHCSPKVWFRCWLTVRRKCADASSCVSHICFRLWRGTCSKGTCKSFTKNGSYTARVGLLGKTTAPKIWSPKMPTQTLLKNQCWFLEATVVWGLPSIQILVLCKFTISSFVNPASVVNRMLAANCVSGTHFSRSHKQNTRLHDGQ